MGKPIRVGGTLVLLFAMMSLVSIALSADQLEERRKRWALEDNADRVRPRPPSGDLRVINISDIEVREIQAAANTLLPKAIVNIGGVTVRCPCEDGPKCTDQVWVVAWRPTHTTGMLFSHIDGKWIVGPVQKWWLEYQQLLDRQRTLSNFDFQVAEDKLFEKMPKCTGEKT